jgi:hypothetical protein
MSQENVEVVRRFNAPHAGEDLMPMIRGALERLGPDPEPEAILAFWAEDPGWQHAHPDIEWDTRAAGAVGGVERRPSGVFQWWMGWTEARESYVYRPMGYRALGASVLNPIEVEACTRDGTP